MSDANADGDNEIYITSEQANILSKSGRVILSRDDNIIRKFLGGLLSLPCMCSVTPDGLMMFLSPADKARYDAIQRGYSPRPNPLAVGK
jgi:hypothetical protein